MHLADLLSEYRLLKYAGFGCAGAGVAYLAHGSIAKKGSLLNRGLASYADYIHRRSHALFLKANPKSVMVAQGFAVYTVVAAAAATRTPMLLAVALLVMVLPWAMLEWKHRRRVVQIEQQTDAFILALANALKSTPSVADAFISLVPIVSEPLKSEIDLANKEMRLGCTLEDAIGNMANRISSRVLDTALASVLIGQRVGGNLPKILETSASALRELNRLESMVRSKTASGRIQMWVISVAPAAFVLFFERTDPKYFEPLTSNPTGLLVLGGALALWITAVVLGRKILRIDV